MRSDREGEAAAEVRDALKQVGLDTAQVVGGPGVRPEVVVVSPQGIRIPLELSRRSLVTERDLPRLLLDEAKGAPQEATHVVVADRITEQARVELRTHGWGWLDLRGHVHLEAPGVFVDARVTPSSAAAEPSKEPLAGRVGLELAVLLLLMRPQAALGIRATAAELGRAPSSVSEEMSRLRDAGLVERDHRPVVPDLFNALAGRWRPDTVDVATLPGPHRDPLDQVLRIAADDPEGQPGWALGGSLAAVAYGVPLHLSDAYPPDLYVPGKVTLRRATQLLGTARRHEDRAGTLRLAPVSAVCSRRVGGTPHRNTAWPLVHPLFVALDLAQDPGRGAEALSSWDPPEGWQRVW
jgi:hypothetical protein